MDIVIKAEKDWRDGATSIGNTALFSSMFEPVVPHVQNALYFRRKVRAL